MWKDVYLVQTINSPLSTPYYIIKPCQSGRCPNQKFSAQTLNEINVLPLLEILTFGSGVYEVLSYVVFMHSGALDSKAT